MSAALAPLYALTANLTREALWGALILLEVFALLSVPSVLLRRRGRPTVALAWLFALFALPAVGGLFWWLFGRTRIERKKRKSAKKKALYAKPENRAPGVGPFCDWFPERAHGSCVFASSGNQIQLLTDGKMAFPALFSELEKAEKTIHLLYYIFEFDSTGRRMVDLLKKKAQAGVSVRLLIDGFGSQRVASRLRKALVPFGVEVAVFLPSRLFPLHAPRINFVNHRKIATIDGRVAFTGGMNIGENYETSWRDLMVRVEGPLVTALGHIFLEDWYFATNQAIYESEPESWPPFATAGAIVASGPDTESWLHDAYFMAITQAKKSLTILTPYFIPTAAIMEALRTAGGRGVDVKIIVPGEASDVWLVKWASRSYYRGLVQANVRVYEYQGPMLHAKALVADGGLVSVGTANIDSRSFGLSFEVSSLFASPSVASELETYAEELLANSREVTRERLAKTSVPAKLAESAAHLLSPIL